MGNVARRTLPGGQGEDEELYERGSGVEEREEGRVRFRELPLMKFMNRFFSTASNLSCLLLKQSSLKS